jgi:hypothetical protein
MREVWNWTMNPFAADFGVVGVVGITTTFLYLIDCIK